MRGKGELLEVFSRVKGEIVIDGKITNYSEYLEVKNCVNNELNTTKQISLYFINAHSISPYILGYMLKLRENDGIEISVVVGNAGLYEFLQSIDFNKFFDIKIKEFVE